MITKLLHFEEVHLFTPDKIEAVGMKYQLEQVGYIVILSQGTLGQATEAGNSLSQLGFNLKASRKLA